MIRLESCEENRNPMASAARDRRSCFSEAFLSAMMTLLLAASWTFAQSPAASGDSAGRLALDRLGTLQGLQEFTNPLLGNTLMTTLDGSQNFTSRLSCPASTEFLNLLAVPSATGDLFQVIIGQDTDLDGTGDASYQVPFGVSGICGNGIISCDPGTWNNCRYYRWTAGSDGRAGLQNATPTALGGCFCINASCGNNLAFSNLGSVLTTLGGGVVGALQKSNPNYAISDVRIDGSAITYFGQNAGSCTPAPATAARELLFNDPVAIAGALDAELAAQSADPGSAYPLLTTSPAARDQTAEIRQCRLERSVNVASVNTLCQFPPPAGALQSNEQTVILKVLSGTFRGNNDCRCSRVSDYCNPPAAAPYASVPEGAVFLGTSAESFRNRSQRDGLDRCTYDSYDYYRLCTRRSDVLSEATIDSCSALDSDPECSLREEVVDGVATYRIFNPTGLSPIESCVTLNGSASSYHICRAWWEKTRSYQCRIGGGFNFDDARRRMSSVTQSVTDQSASVRFQDFRQDENGSWISIGGSIGAPARATFAGCEMACKTRRPIQDTDAGAAGHTGQFRTSTQSYEFFYRSCGGGSCPAGPGEELLKDCQCIDEFAEAAALMSALERAGEDLICSSGVKR